MWYCVIQNRFWVGRSFAWWFTSNTKAYWLVLFMNDKPHMLRLSFLVNMEFVIPFTAPPIPISNRLSWAWYWAGRVGGGGGRPFVLWMFSTMMRSSCSCWIIPLLLLVVYRLRFSGTPVSSSKILISFWKKTIPKRENFKFLSLIDVSDTLSLLGANRSRDQWHEPKREASIKFEFQNSFHNWKVTLHYDWLFIIDL